MGSLSVAILLAVVGAGVGLRLYMDRTAENRLLPGEDITIAELRGPLPGNAFLACPPGQCQATGAAASPVFATGADRLYQAFRETLTTEPRVAAIAVQPLRLVLLQRSAVLRFPDIVVAEFVALGPGRSSVALYSRARYGRYDFGVNRDRVQHWLARLEELAPRQ